MLIKIFELLKQGYYPKKIAEELGVSKQRINYYIKKLKDSGIIKKKGYGVWEVISDLSSLKKVVRKKNKKYVVRTHALIFSFKTPNLPSFNVLIKKLDYNNFKIKLNKAYGRVRSLIFNYEDFNIWFFKDKTIIYLKNKKSYYGLNAFENKEVAVRDVLRLVKWLENKLGINLKSDSGKYEFFVSRQHHALIKNELAKYYDKQKQKIQVVEEEGIVWFLIDNSFNLWEAETTHPRTATSDNQIIKDFLNDLRNNPTTPTQVLELINKNALTLQDLINNQKEYSEAIKEHIEAIRTLGVGVSQLVMLLNELKKLIKK